MMTEGERTDVGRCDSSQVGLRVVRRRDLDDCSCQRKGRRVRKLHKDGERRQKGDLPSAPTMLRPFRPWMICRSSRVVQPANEGSCQ